MTTFITVFMQMLALLIMIGVGFFATKKGMLDDHSSTKISSLILNIFNPLLSVSSACGAIGQVSMGELGFVALIAVGLFAYFIAAGMFLSPMFGREQTRRNMFQLMFTFSNLGFMGIPVVNCVMGSEYVIYVTEFMIIYNIVFYTYGIAVMEGKFTRASIKKLASLSNFIILCAVLILVFNVELPSFLSTAVTYLGNATSPLAMITIGFALAQSSIRDIFTNKRILLFSIVKLLVLPLIALQVLRFLPMSQDMLVLCIIMFGMPVGNMPLILGKEKGLDCTDTSAGIVMTTLLCLFTIPILVALI